MVKNRTKRSDQAIALWRRSARMCRIEGLSFTAEVLSRPEVAKILLDYYRLEMAS